ncbi:MAG: hypothetical protein LUD17_08435 [Bacteroidales bacterium]|nr:hypothetical protein [Bacteroidales bacterium]
MKHFAVALMLLLSTSAWAQKYYYEGGYFERDGVNWCEYRPDNQMPCNYYKQVGAQENYFIIADATSKIAVPKTPKQSFLIADPETGDWKFLCFSVDPNAPKRKPGLSADLKEKVVKNFRATTPYDGIHLYTSPFGFLNTPNVTCDEARTILNSNDSFATQLQPDGTLVVERKGNIGYENFGAASNTMISGQFDAGRIKKCTYVFTFDDTRQAAAAKAHLVKHMGIASSGRDGQRYKVAWLKEISYFDMRTEEEAGKARFIVDVEYK